MTKPIDPQFGFASPIPGHVLEISDPPTYSSRRIVTCTCGAFTTYIRPMKDGRAGLRSRKAWADHLDSTTTDITQAHFLGTIVTPRLTHEIMIAPNLFTGIEPYVSGSGKYLSTTAARPAYRYCWSVLVRTTANSGKGVARHKLDSVYHNSQTSAESRARRLLDKAQNDGHTVTGGSSRNAGVAVIATFTVDSFVRRVDHTINSGTSRDALQTLTEINEILGATATLEAARDRLRAHVRKTQLGDSHVD